MQPQKIALVRRNGIGDLLMTLPLLFWLRERIKESANSNSHLLLVVDSRHADCAKWIDNAPWDELLIMEGGAKYLSALKLAFDLRKRKLDLVISSKPTAMKLMSLIVGFSGAKARLAVTGNSSWGLLTDLFINLPVKRKEIASYSHQASQVLHLVAPVDVMALEPRYYPKMKKVEGEVKEEFERVLASDLVGSKIKIYLNLSNNRDASQLGFEQVFKALDQVDQAKHLILGALPSDLKKAQQWQEEFKSRKVSSTLAIGHNLGFTLAALQSSSICLTGDGGLMHLAAACQCPLVALFGQTCPAKWHPLSKNAVALADENRANLIDPKLIAQAFDYLLQSKEELSERDL